MLYQQPKVKIEIYKTNINKTWEKQNQNTKTNNKNIRDNLKKC